MEPDYRLRPTNESSRWANIPITNPRRITQFSMILQTTKTAPAGTGSIWHRWVDDIQAGKPIDAAQAEAILSASDLDLLDLISAAYRLRYQHFGNSVQLYFLVNAKSGLCPEDCSYCSQSKISNAPIEKYRMLSVDQLLDGARAGQGTRFENLLHRHQRPGAERTGNDGRGNGGAKDQRSSSI